MKSIKFIFPTLVASVMFLGISSCSKSDAYVAPQVTDPNTSKINIEATQFNPNSLTLALGSKITWTNTDTQVHSVVSDDGTSFNSGTLSAGASFSFTPAANGIYNYHCAQHPAVTGVLYIVTR